VRNPKRIGSGSRPDSYFAQLDDRLAGEGHLRLVDTGFLAGADSGDPYSPEIGSRIGGVTSMTNVTAGACADIPRLHPGFDSGPRAG
jgi:hypothetical protein